MRFRFPGEADDLEAGARALVLERMRAWWRAFAASADAIDRHFTAGAPFQVPEFMDQHLGAVDERLMWEYGPAVGAGRHRLVITPEDELALRPMVEVLLGLAPRLPAWEFHGARLPEPPELVEGMVEARAGTSVEGWRACVQANADLGIDLTFWSPRISGPDDDPAWRAAAVAAEVALGEALFHRRVDGIAVADRPVAGTSEVPLAALREQVLARVAALDGALPGAPLHAAEGAGTGVLLKLEPTQAADYPGQADLFVAKTTQLPMWRRAHGGRTFDSSRFSRQGETFCFLKVDGSVELDPAGFQDKAAIEDALDLALQPAGLGCTIGGGTGLRYSYVDLALVDVPRAIPVIQAALRAGRLPRRTWLQFFDSTLGGEWVGLWPDSPRPPGFEGA